MAEPYSTTHTKHQKYQTNKQAKPYINIIPSQDFPGGAVVKNPPAHAGDMGSIPRPGRSHMPWSN